jgi:Domain of unknown function (DUF5979)
VAKRLVLLVGLSAVAALALGPVPAGAGRAFQVVEVTKVVQGTPPPGTQFEVAVSCTGVNGPTESGTLTFDGTGGTQEFDAGGGSQSCTVSEPGTGGASAVSFSCTPVEQATCNSSTSNMFQSDVARVSYVVTNTFEPPPPAPEAAVAIEAAPAFTG